MAGTPSQGDFDLDFNAETRTIVFRPLGHWTRDTVDRWEIAIEAMIQRHRSAGAGMRFVVDLSARSAHAQDIAARVRAGVARFAPAFERVAIVRPRSAIMGMQAKRIASASDGAVEHQRQFGPDDFDMALRWAASGAV